MLDAAWAKRGVLGSITTILVLTVLEMPAPIGFETRPQGDVSLFWLAFFLVIVVSEIATMLLIFKRPKLGATIGLVAATLNILQVIADQTHMMQPEVATLGYSLLEGAVVIASLALAYFAWAIHLSLRTWKHAESGMAD